MAQQVNPIIFRLGLTKQWNSKYIEKKLAELPYFEFQSLELKKFTLKFLKDKGFDVHQYKINYCSNGYLNIFLSCYKIPKKDFIENQTVISKNQNNSSKKNYSDYQILKYNTKIINQNYSNSKLFTLKQNLTSKYYKFSNLEENLNYITSLQTINRSELSFFFNDFIESLMKFIGKKLTIMLTFQILTKTIKKNLDKSNIEFIQKKITRLNKYKQNSFFKEGLNTLYICSKQNNSATLLAEFISIQLTKNKKQYNKFFLNFIKKCLQSFKKENSLKTNNIKIQIKGRLSKGARAKKMVFKIANKLPILTLKANIDYSERVAYTSNGTVGIKVWIYNQN